MRPSTSRVVEYMLSRTVHSRHARQSIFKERVHGSTLTYSGRESISECYILNALGSLSLSLSLSLSVSVSLEREISPSLTLSVSVSVSLCLCVSVSLCLCVSVSLCVSLSLERER
jgi:hypothetical protein